jgi:hypothetical protein
MVDRYKAKFKEKPMGSEKGRRLRSAMTLPRLRKRLNSEEDSARLLYKCPKVIAKGKG